MTSSIRQIEFLARAIVNRLEDRGLVEFGDVPLLRMTHLRAWQEDAPFAMAENRVDIQLIAGGGYDPLTDLVTLHVAVPCFTIRATRVQIARALRGASGAPRRYPGVICSREGQELHVPSAAPLMVTDPL